MPTVVVAALSARQLASSARRAGWNVIALDCFGDADTRAVAQRWLAIGAADAIRIDGERFLAALRGVSDTPDCLGWIAGAGFEPALHLLEDGAHVLPLLGNTPLDAAHVRDPRRFFSALDGLGIAHPPSQLRAPPAADGWLVKDFASSGGWHVRRAVASDLLEPGTQLSLPRDAGEGWGGGGKHAVDDDKENGVLAAPHPSPPPQAGEEVYFQREVAGRAMSLLFLGDGKRATPIAINALRVRAVGARPFVYHGAIGPVSDLPPHVSMALTRAATALVTAFHLRGLGSLDVLVDGETVHVLEVNARPTGTLALYDTQVPHGLLHWHVAACRGELPDPPLRIDPRRVFGEATVFARRRCHVSADHVARFAGLGCRDIPQPNSDIAPGAPVCTVTAHDATVTRVDEQLAAREAAVLALVQNRNEGPPDGH